MRPLKEMCLQRVWTNLDFECVRRRICWLPPDLRTMLMERVLSHDALTGSARDLLFGSQFFADVTKLRIPENSEITDRILKQIAVSCGKLSHLVIVVPLLEPRSEVRVSASGLASVLAHQNELEELELVWCRGFQPGVINRIRSEKLRRVSLTGGGSCRCIPLPADSRNQEIHFEREFGVLGRNNPNISFLRLEGIVLDLEDYRILLGAISESLEHLEIKVFPWYKSCKAAHAFSCAVTCSYSFQLINKLCTKLETLVVDCEFRDKDIPTFPFLDLRGCAKLQVLSLSGFCPGGVCLPVSLRKLSFSTFSGLDGAEHWIGAVASLPKLDQVEVTFGNNSNVYISRPETALLASLVVLGDRIIGLSGITGDPAIMDLCLTNLNKLELSGEEFAPSVIEALLSDSVLCSNLTTLSFRGTNVSPKTLLDIAEHCKMLESLDLAYSRFLDDHLLGTIARNCCDSLQVLDISLCENVRGAGIVAVAICCKNLIQLNMFKIALSDQVVIALADHSPKLLVCGNSLNGVSDRARKKLVDNCYQRVILMGKTN